MVHKYKHDIETQTQRTQNIAHSITTNIDRNRHINENTAHDTWTYKYHTNTTPDTWQTQHTTNEHAYKHIFSDILVVQLQRQENDPSDLRIGSTFPHGYC